MKKVILSLLLSLSSLGLWAQDGIGENFRKVSGKQQTYWVSEVTVVGNIKFLRYVDIRDSIRLIPYEYPLYAPRPEFPDRSQVWEIIKNLISEELKKNHTPLNNENEYVSVIPIADEKGDIRELILSVPKRWQIPVSVIDECMVKVREGGFRLTYNRNNRFLKNETIRNYPYPFMIRARIFRESVAEQ